MKCGEGSVLMSAPAKQDDSTQGEDCKAGRLRHLQGGGDVPAEVGKDREIAGAGSVVGAPVDGVHEVGQGGVDVGDAAAEDEGGRRVKFNAVESADEDGLRTAKKEIAAGDVGGALGISGRVVG